MVLGKEIITGKRKILWKRRAKRRRGMNRKTAVKIAIDLVTILISFMAAIFIRFEFSPPWENIQRFAVVSPALAALFVLSNGLFGIYRGRWKYASFDEALHLALGAAVGMVTLFFAALFIPGGRSYVPLSVALMGGVLSLIGMAFTRLQFRYFREMRLRSSPNGGKRVLLVGAGEAGEMVARDMLRHPEYGYAPAAFVDDDPGKRNLVIQGIPVLGTRNEIPEIIRKERINEIIITIPSARGKDIREIVDICERTDAAIKILPGILGTLSGEAGMSAVRELELEDLLARELVEADLNSISGYITGKVVLVTGAAGSIGSELSRQLIVLGPSRLLLLDTDESELFDLEQELLDKKSRGSFAS
jgi:FlaA1/EpsC-like NDP-sugar epimerase